MTRTRKVRDSVERSARARRSALAPLLLATLACTNASSDHVMPQPVSNVGGGGAGTQLGGSPPLQGPGPLNLGGQQPAPSRCPAGTETTLSGTVYAPNGTLPLFNAVVYAPNAPVPPFTPTVACERCSGEAAAQSSAIALTDSNGRFTLRDVPAGTDVPLVIQVGRWRRQVRIPSVVECQANTVTSPELLRLPRNRREGDIPRIAVTTGDCDNLVCLLPKIGIDPEEWGIAGEGKAVTFYHGLRHADFYQFPASLAQMKPAEELWSSVTELANYDLVLSSCECEEAPQNKGPAAYDAMTRYLSMGGRLFGTDYQYVWFLNSTDANLRGAFEFERGGITARGPLTLDTSFPKGRALSDWYDFVSPPPAAHGIIPIDVIYEHFTGVSSTAQVWGWSLSDAGLASGAMGPRVISVNTPAGVPIDQQCGRAVHLDMHVSKLTLSPSSRLVFPNDCGPLTPGEMLMAFFLFDVAACVQDDGKPPMPP